MSCVMRLKLLDSYYTNYHAAMVKKDVGFGCCFSTAASRMRVSGYMVSVEVRSLRHGSLPCESTENVCRCGVEAYSRL